MTKKLPVTLPASYVTPTAIGFTDSGGGLQLVTSGTPMPVVVTSQDAIIVEKPVALTGTTKAALVAGPFEAVQGSPIHLQLSGTWTGRVTVKRSTDNGATSHPLTVGGMAWASFTGNVNEPIWEENVANVTFWLDIQVASGSVSYQVSQ